MLYVENVCICVPVCDVVSVTKLFVRLPSVAYRFVPKNVDETRLTFRSALRVTSGCNEICACHFHVSCRIWAQFSLGDLDAVPCRCWPLTCGDLRSESHALCKCVSVVCPYCLHFSPNSASETFMHCHWLVASFLNMGAEWGYLLWP